jgi:hypothetical protein
MKSVNVLIFISLVAAVTFAGRMKPGGSLVPSTAGSPVAKTGAPGEPDCTQCHTGTPQNGASALQLDFGGAISYIPGNIYTVTLNLTDASAKNGFQLTVRDNLNTTAGVLVATDGVNTQKQSSASKEYITHKTAGSPLSTWSFQWTAPTAGTGDVTFYIAANKSNALNNTGGDVIYLHQVVLPEDLGNGVTESSNNGMNFWYDMAGNLRWKSTKKVESLWMYNIAGVQISDNLPEVSNSYEGQISISVRGVVIIRAVIEGIPHIHRVIVPE